MRPSDAEHEHTAGSAMPAYEVKWDAEALLLTTRVRRALSIDEVNEYSTTLARALAEVPDGTSFRWLSNSTGYEPLANRAAHAVYRSILPKTLAEHGLRTSLFDLYEADVAVRHERDVTCRTIAHVHHDTEKMKIFDERLGRENERYFSDENSARDWLLEH
jgi:hypothetical protein